jgi:hypothetical protein
MEINYSAQNRKKSPPMRFPCLTLGIAIAAIWSAISTQKALNLTREIAIADQRPIVWLTNRTDTPLYFPAPATLIAWNWEFTNYGKSPALHVSFDTYMSLDNGPWLLTYGRQKATVGAPLPPGKIDFDTVFSKPGITDADFTRLMATESGKDFRHH